MNSKQYITLAIAIVILGAGVYYSELRFLSASQPNAAATSTAAQGDTLAARDATSTKTAGIEFTLSVGGQNYNGTVPTGATVLDAMEALEAEGAFRFTSKEFSGMGTFIDSINGKANSNGFYWILYVNGVSSQTGVSQTALHSGDRIEWRFEKGY